MMLKKKDQKNKQQPLIGLCQEDYKLSFLLSWCMKNNSYEESIGESNLKGKVVIFFY
jgi:hypothetical protein